METKKVKISLLDRVTIPSVVKKEGDFNEMIISSDINKKTGIKQDDLVKYNIKTAPGGGITWDSEINTDLEVEFTELEFKMIVDGIKKLNEEKKLTQDHIGLYKAFVEYKKSD